CSLLEELSFYSRLAHPRNRTPPEWTRKPPKTDCVAPGSSVTSAQYFFFISAGRVDVLTLWYLRRRLMRRLHPSIAVLVLLLALCPTAVGSAQTVSATTGAINGKVTDATGGVLPGVTV